MSNKLFALADKLEAEGKLGREEYLMLIENNSSEVARYLAEKALAVKEKHYGNKIFIRGLIEISNICKNDCYYCGIRKSNENCQRYRITKEDILSCCAEGYDLGFRTFVLQGGEDGYFSDSVLSDIVSSIKSRYPECAITLSVGERSFDSYKLLKEAGADRYLLRHETATPAHYRKLHPENLSWERRIECLHNLKDLGYQVGCGFMVGSPGQTNEMLSDELMFIQNFMPHMCGIGPFIPHKDTCFSAEPAGSVDMTCMLLSCIRLIHPKILLPATTALGTMHPNGREKGILSGANVVMPNLSPASVRKKYMLYDNKLSDGAESAQAKNALEEGIKAIGCEIEISRGDALN